MNVQIMPPDFQEFIRSENAHCELRNAEPLDNLTIKSLMGIMYDELWADG